MPVTNIKSRWDTGNLIFHESTRLDDQVNVLSLAPGIVTIGNADNDVDFKIHMGTEGTGEAYALFNCGEKKVYFTGLSCELDGDLDVTVGDISLTDDQDIMFGDSDDVLMRFATTGDTSNPVFVLALDDTSQQMHITDKAAVNTNWGRTAGSDPEVAIHSDTTPISNYLAIGNHDGTTAHIDVVGGTTLSLDIAGTPEVVIATASTSPATSGSNALGTASLMWTDLFLADTAVINFNAGDVTITHGTDTLTLASTWTADAVGRPWGVNLTLSVLGGNYVNAIKGYVDCTTNDGGTIGLLSAVNCEIAMPDVCRGAYYPLEIEWVGLSSTEFGAPGTGSQSGFMSINCSGFRDYIDSAGVFFTLNGLTAGIGGMLGAGSSTLRIDINQGTTMYIPLSTVEASYTSAYLVAITIEDPTAPVNAIYGEASIGEAYSTGSVNAVKGLIPSDVTTGDVHNMAAGWFGLNWATGFGGVLNGVTRALNAEVVNDSGVYPSTILFLQSVPGTNADHSNMPYMVFSEDATGPGSNVLFEVGFEPSLAYCTSGSDLLYYQDTLRIKVNPSAGSHLKRYIPLSSVTGTFTYAYPIVATYAAPNTSRAIYVNPSLATPNMADGSGLGIEVNATITGSAGGNAAASSSWLNIDAVLQNGGYYCARTDGIYEGTATLNQANLIFGARMQAQLSSSDFRRLCPFSLNSTQDISALFMIGVGDATVGIKKADSGGVSQQMGSLKIAIDQDGNIYYVKLWKDEAGT